MIKENSFILEDGQLDYPAIEKLTSVEFVEELKIKLKNIVVKKSSYETNNIIPSIYLNFYAEGEYLDYAFINCYFSGRKYFSINKINRYVFDDLGFKIIKK